MTWVQVYVMRRPARCPWCWQSSSGHGCLGNAVLPLSTSLRAHERVTAHAVKHYAQELLEEAAVPAEAEWAALSQQLAADPRWQALPSDEVRRACGSAAHAPRMREGSCMPLSSSLKCGFSEQSR